jgi:sulfur carrier protein
MRVLVNGEPRVLPDTATVSDLVEDLGRGPKGIAVARNGEVVPRSTWTDAPLHDDDTVEVLEAARGG